MAQGTLKRKPLRDALRSRHTHKDKAHKRGATCSNVHSCERCMRTWHERESLAYATALTDLARVGQA